MPAADPRITERGDFNVWRIHRIDDTAVPMQVSDPLPYEGQERFPAAELTPSNILERWGAGRYACHLFQRTEDAKRTVYIGRTSAFMVDEIGGVAPITPPSRRKREEPRENSPSHATASPGESAAAPIASAPTVTAPVVSVPTLGASPPPVGNPMDLFVWMVGVHDRANENAARQREADYARMRLEAEERIARERANSAQMLAQQQQFFEAMTKAARKDDGKQSEVVTALNALTTRLDEVQEQLDEVDEKSEIPAAKQSELAQAITGLTRLIEGPVGQAVVSKVMGGGGT